MTNEVTGARGARLWSFREGAKDVWVAPRSQVPAFDALRSAAIFMVVAGHFAFVGGEVFSRSRSVFRTPLFWFGWTGVDLFFVLSGLLIGRQLWRELAATGTVDVGAFMLRRGFRIWPLYFAATVLSPILTGTWSYRWGDWLFLSNYVGGRVEGGWSLATEEQFYIVAPIILMLGARVLRPRMWLAMIPTGLGIVAVARWRTAQELLQAGINVHDVKQALYTPFHLHNEGLAVGLLIAFVAVHAPEWLNDAPRRRIRTAAGLSVALVVAVGLRRQNDVVFPFLSLGLIYGTIVVGLLSIGGDHPAILRARPFYTISRLSYGMYLNHFAVLHWIAPDIAQTFRHVIGDNVAAVASALIITVACSVAIAYVTFVLIERPFLVIRERRTRRHAVTQPIGGVRDSESMSARTSAVIAQ